MGWQLHWPVHALAGARAEIDTLEVALRDSAAISASQIKELKMRIAELEGQLTRVAHVEVLTAALANAEQSAQQKTKALEEAMAEIKRAGCHS